MANVLILYFLCSHCAITITLQSGDQPMVLCFVEFNDAKCALTALEALQGLYVKVTEEC